MTGVSLRRLPTIFARLKGRNDTVREYQALISPASEYCLIPKVDAYRLGYPEAARDDIVNEPPNLFRGVTYDGFWEGMLISMKEVSIGDFAVPNVDFIAYDLPQASAFDVILGRSLLASSRMQIDYGAGVLRIRPKEAGR
jgi:hypothetical protein